MNDFKTYLANNSSQNINVIYAAGLIGQLIHEGLKENNIKLDFFCDADKAKWNTTINQIKVISPEDLQKLDNNTNVFMGSYQFDFIIPFLENLGKKNIFAAKGLVTENFLKNYTGPLLSEYNTSPKKLLRVMEYYNKSAQKPDYIKNKELIVKTLDVQITEKCSLKCKDCSNLMQYYKNPKDSDIDVLMKSIDRFMDSIDSLDEFRVLGGDPFMNKDMYKIVNKLVEHKKCKRVAVFTNARIVPKGNNLECLKNDKVVMDLSNYGAPSSKHDEVVELCKKENITCNSFRFNEWQDCGTIKINNRSDEVLEKQFANCSVSDLISILNGKLYRCPFAANASNLKAIPYESKDEVNLIDESLSIPELREQIYNLTYKKKFIKACGSCNGRDFMANKIPAALQTKTPLEYKEFN
jgi:organic radical activating enzyme